jgi:hypothetical protein
MKKEIDLFTGTIMYKTDHVIVVWNSVDTDNSVYTIERVIIRTPFEDGIFSIVVPVTDLYLHSQTNLRKISNRIAESLSPVVLMIRSGLTNREELVTVIKQILDQICQEPSTKGGNIK